MLAITPITSMSPLLSISELAYALPQESQKTKITVQMAPEPLKPIEVIKNIASIDGPIDIWCWYEGVRGIPKKGASFMEKSLFTPIFREKSNVKLNLYSLKAWDFMLDISKMPETTRLGSAINRINKKAVECFSSSSFFKYCASVSKGSELYAFIQDTLPKKQRLIELSANRKKKNKTVGSLFNKQASLLDCMSEKDVNLAYPQMQYVEGYYLIRESVRRGLEKKQQKIEIVFLLPNNEGEYYEGISTDLEEMLTRDFGAAVEGVEINISFHFFNYGKEIFERPYIDKSEFPQMVKPKEISAYFDFCKTGEKMEE